MVDLKNTTLDDIAGVIGFSATVRLAAHYGGRDLHVPLAINDSHPVCKLIGVSRMQRLNSEWGGQRLSVPSLNLVDCEVRSGRVLTLLLAGLTTGQTANITGLTERRVQQLKKDYVQEGLLDSDNLLEQPEIEGKISLENAWGISTPKFEMKTGI